MASRSVRASTKHTIMTVNQIVPGIGATTTIGAAAMIGARGRLSPVAYAANATIAAGDLVHGYITNTGAGAAITLTAPAAADIVQAFAEHGIPLETGKAFDVRFESLAVYAINLAASATVTFAAGAGPMVMNGSLNGIVRFRMTSPAAFSMTYYTSA